MAACWNFEERARGWTENEAPVQNLEGIENMTQLPDTMFVIDSNAEEIAVKEARRMAFPWFRCDTNCDPDMVDWIIPGNDDACAPSACSHTKIADSVAEGRAQYEQSQVADQKAAAESGPRLEAGPDYVDTSAYEKYEKQEGEFVEGTEAFIEAGRTTFLPTRIPLTTAQAQSFCWPGAESEIHTGPFFVRVCNREFRKEKRMSTSKPVMEIPAKLVKELRELTNAGFSDCRAALWRPPSNWVIRLTTRNS